MRFQTARPRGDSGAAMLTVVLVGVILTGMGLALARTSIANLDNAGRDRVSSGALGIAEAGVAAAIDHIRSAGVHHLCATCPSAWNTSAPQTLTFTGGSAVVSISAIEAYSPPAVRVGRYLVRAVGQTTGASPGMRTIEQEIAVQPLDFPLGVYTAAKVNLQGTVKIQQESFFSGQCIDSREKMSFVAGLTGSYIDPYNDIPAGAHSATYIREKQGACGPEGGGNYKLVHSANPCDEDYWSDQSSLGGPYTTGTCAAKTAGKGDYDTAGSHFSMDVLEDRYGFRPKGLTDDQYALLRSKAATAGTYFPASRPFRREDVPTMSLVPGSPGYKPVIYIEDQNVSLTDHFVQYAWDDSDTITCANLHASVLLVIRNGNLDVGANTAFTGNVFAPEGAVKYAGGAQLVGTLFAESLTFTGNGQMGLNDCAARSTHGGLLTIAKQRFREIDS